MSNEELAIKAKNGDTGAKAALWLSVECFARQQAKRYKLSHCCRADVEDLTQAGFLAMLKAIEEFDAERGKFLAVYGYYLKNAFSEETGTKTSKRDATQYSQSLDAVIGNAEGELTLLDILEDETAAADMTSIECDDLLRYTRHIISAALETLAPDEAALISNVYLFGVTLEQYAAAEGRGSKQNANNRINAAFYKLRHGKYAKELISCIYLFDDYRFYKDAAKSNSSARFSAYGMSAVEAKTILNEWR